MKWVLGTDDTNQSAKLICSQCADAHIEIFWDTHNNGYVVHFWFYCADQQQGLLGDYEQTDKPIGKELNELQSIMEQAYV